MPGARTAEPSICLQEKKLFRLNPSSLPSYQLWGLLVTLAGLFLMGGSSRADVQSLAFLQPAMILCCGAALMTLKLEHCHNKKWILASIGLIFLLLLLYLVPLPEKFENISPGAANVSAVLATADVSNGPRMFAITPAAIWDTLFFLFGPLAVFLFAIQLNRDDLLLTLPIIIFAVTVSGVIGLLQIVGSADGPLYFYRITNTGNAVGLFANRNHAAVLLACLFPMLAVFAARSHPTRRGGRNTRQMIAIAIAITLVPLILVTGSRSGMLTAVLGLAGGAFLHTKISSNGRADRGRLLKPSLAAVALLGLIFVTIYFSRAEAIARFFDVPRVANDRALFWASSLEMFWQYFPFGFGPGSFAAAFKQEEPLTLLGGTYLNRLHNDWLETGLTFGAPGVLLMLFGGIYYVRRSFLLWFRMNGARSAVAIGRMASIIIAMLGIASISDYPLRTPAMMGYAALVLLWFAHARRETA
jgi:O-antigen ligase